jgi:predicted amidohydrolase
MKVAAIQATPVYLNPKKTAEKALGLMTDAAKEGAELCAVPEVFLAGYPIWLPAQASSMDVGLRKECFSKYLDAAVDPDSPDLNTGPQTYRL